MNKPSKSKADMELRRTYSGTPLSEAQWKELKITGCVIVGDKIIRTMAFIKRVNYGARKDIDAIASKLFASRTTL